MPGHFGLLDTNFQTFFARISNEVSLLSGAVVLSVLLLCVFITINHFKSKKILEKATLPITDVSGESGLVPGFPSDPMPMRFVKELLAWARSKGVPAAMGHRGSVSAAAE
jgi:hypothetical protein